MYFNFLNATPVNTRSKVARFEQLIIADKNVIQPRTKASNDDDDVQGTRASTKKDNEPVEERLCDLSCIFQSTGGTNITSVNALSLVELYVHE